MDFKLHLKKYLNDEEINSLLESFNDEDKHSLLLNTSKISNEDFLNLYENITSHPLVKNGYYYDKNEYQFGKLFMHDAGVYYLQEPSAMIVASLLQPNENDIVLDMCAAPGGKTIQASLLMENKGLIFANDLSYARAKILSSNVERMGRKNIVVTSMDLKKFPSSYNGKFTKIILDAPCSGSGMFRKDDKFLLDWTYEKVLKCAETQKELIDIAHRLLSSGGTLIYSTCSYSYEEDEEIVQYALNTYDDLELIKIPENQYFKSYNNIGIHLFPSCFEGEGHYICLLRKKGNIESIYLPNNKQKPNPKYIKTLKDLGLENTYPLYANDSLYALDFNIDLTNITVLRAGLKVCEFIKDNIIPDYALSHYLPSDNSIDLSEEQKNKYIHGDTFNINDSYKNGFYIVSYNNINLGYVKVVNGVCKNHYPKGLRH